MAISGGQIPQALVTVQALASTLNDIKLLLGQAQELISKNWQVDIGSRFPIIVTVTPEQQAGMIAQYDALKSALVATFQNLP